MHLNRPNDHARSGFTLIELLVVLIIVSILATVGVSSLGSRSPKAVRSGLVTLRAAIFDARQSALASGQVVKLTMTSAATTSYKLTAADLAGASRMQFSLDPSVVRYATLAAAVGDLPDATVQGLQAAISFGFDNTSVGWTHNLVGTNTYGFSPTGQVVGIAADNSVSPLTQGLWLGLVARTPNTKGVAYGVVLVSQQGQIIAFYKGDSKLDDTPDHKWQRLE